MVVDCYALLAGHRDSILNHLTNMDGLENGGEFVEKVRRIEAANDHLLRAFTLSPERKAQKTVEINRALELAPEHPAAALVAAAQERLRLSADVDLTSLPLADLRERARALLRYGPYDRALAALEEWVAREPASAEAHSALGTCLLLMGRFEAAIQHLSQATALDTSSADTHFNLGVAYMQTNQPARAVAALRQAITLAPGMARAHAQLGTAYGMLRQVGPAVQHLRRAVFLDPELPDARARATLDLRHVHRDLLLSQAPAFGLDPDLVVVDDRGDPAQVLDVDLPFPGFDGVHRLSMLRGHVVREADDAPRRQQEQQDRRANDRRQPMCPHPHYRRNHADHNRTNDQRPHGFTPEKKQDPGIRETPPPYAGRIIGACAGTVNTSTSAGRGRPGRARRVIGSRSSRKIPAGHPASAPGPW